MKNYLILSTLMAVCGLIHTGSLSAQTFTTLYSFQAAGNGYAPNPAASLTLSGRTLYGTAAFGGSTGFGSVFGFNLDNSSFTNLYNFSQPSFNGSENAFNIDGMWPYSNLILAGNSLYGLTEQGGTGDAGTLFRVNTDGTGFADLNNFLNFPSAETAVLLGAHLVFTNNLLFGTATFGGTYGYGTIFADGTNNMGFTTLHTFTDGTDGGYPLAGVVSGTNFYGAAYLGGSSGNGTIFKVSTNGIGFTVLHSFTATSRSVPYNSDGARPSGLILSGNTLYGTTSFGGSSANGTVFRLNVDGTDFTNLYSFSASPGSGNLDGTNNDGAGPESELVLSGNTLYGIAFGAGQFGHGTIFSLTTNGKGFTVVYTFTAGVTVYGGTVTNNDGAYPIGGLILSSNILYGTTTTGGTPAFGTLFSLTLPPPPQLTMSLSKTNLILTWPTNVFGFAVQSSTNLFPAVWGSGPTAVVVNGLNTVTNPISGRQMFYRLSQ